VGLGGLTSRVFFVNHRQRDQDGSGSDDEQTQYRMDHECDEDVERRPGHVERSAGRLARDRLTDSVELANGLGRRGIALFDLRPGHQAIQDIARKETVEPKRHTHQDT